ncbi:uncharacterized protein J3D65DRAFT_280554 [Phyllosticta citribraziliensis]|uniref:Uncharacterized protein n=1 Tax=Phyllosticta citribraziliensis TaxID=989973 RepID=A0ABR1LWB5_9PEZI
MLTYRGSRILRVFVYLPPLAIGWYARDATRRFKQLEQQYPSLDPDDTNSTTALTTPFFWNHQYYFHTPHIDIFSAKVPARALQRASGDSDAKSFEEAWARKFLSSPVLRAESRLFGLGSPGDCGEDGMPQGRALLNGLFIVVRAPETHAPVLLRWDMAPGVVGFFRTMATQLGYPWRMMSGGRHELSVGEVDADGMVEVRFSSAHDYEWLPGEGNEQKTIPNWVLRLHRTYARWLLDERVRELSNS